MEEKDLPPRALSKGLKNSLDDIALSSAGRLHAQLQGLPEGSTAS